MIDHITFVDFVVLGGKAELIDGKIQRYIQLHSINDAEKLYRRLCVALRDTGNDRLQLNRKGTIVTLTIEMLPEMYQFFAERCC